VRQPLQRQRQVSAAAGFDHRVDLVHNHRAHGLEHFPAALGGKQEIERFGGGDQDVRGVLEHGGPLGRRGIPGPHRRSYPGGIEPHLFRHLADLAPRLGQVLVDVAAQGLERGDVNDPGLLGQLVLDSFPQEMIQRGEKGGQGFPGSGRGGDQGVAAVPNGFPALGLDGGWLADLFLEPAGDSGVE
jgi:hypothetical protein